MDSEGEIKELEKNRRLSGQAIPVYAGLLGISALILWGVGRFVRVPPWVSIIVLGMTAFTLVGDVFNYFYCGWKLRKLRGDGAR